MIKCPICESIKGYRTALNLVPGDDDYKLAVLAVGAIILIHCKDYEPCRSCQGVYLEIRRAHMTEHPEHYNASN